MSRAKEILDKIKEDLVSGSQPTTQTQTQNGPIISDEDQDGPNKGRKTGSVWVKQDPQASWEVTKYDDQVKANQITKQASGKPIDQIRKIIQGEQK